MNKILWLVGLTGVMVALAFLISPLFTRSSVVVEKSASRPVKSREEQVRDDGRTLLPRSPDQKGEARDTEEEEEEPPPPPSREEEPQAAPLEHSALTGLGVEDAGPSDLTELKVPEGMTGVIVRFIHPASPAAEAQLKAGDVIVRAQRDKISSAESLRAAVGDRDHTLLTVYRDGYPFQVVLHKPFREAGEPHITSKP